jgi:hypothetical protein
VEEKGYKRMINLPDWLNIQNIFLKLKNSGKIGEFSSSFLAFFPAGQRRCEDNFVFTCNTLTAGIRVRDTFVNSVAGITGFQLRSNMVLSGTDRRRLYYIPSPGY